MANGRRVIVNLTMESPAPAETHTFDTEPNIHQQTGDLRIETPDDDLGGGGEDGKIRMRRQLNGGVTEEFNNIFGRSNISSVRVRMFGLETGQGEAVWGEECTNAKIHRRAHGEEFIKGEPLFESVQFKGPFSQITDPNEISQGNRPGTE